MNDWIVWGIGLIFGSFANVFIVRMPHDLSIIKPRCGCPKCENTIAWWQNIPVISYILLWGKCGFCKNSISIRYPIIEILTGFLFWCIYQKFGMTLLTPAFFIFVLWLVILSAIDLEHYILPDELTLSGVVLGFLASIFLGFIPWLDSFLGILIGGGILYAIAWSYEKWTKNEGLGGGDIKLLAMLGAWLGIKSILPIVVLSSFVGSFVGIFLLVFRRKNMRTAIPFGPFLAASAMLWLFFQEELQKFFFPTFPN